MAKRSAENDRRRRIEELKRKQRRAERRRTFAAVGGAALVAVLLIGGAVYASAHRDLRTKAQKAAGCLKVQHHSGAPGGEHIGPGSKKPDQTTVDYKEVPPNSGPHLTDPLPENPKFFPRESAPPPERAVHNLEHGFVVAWYDKDLPQKQVDELSKSSINLGQRLIGVPWTRSTFAKDRHIVLTAWNYTLRCKTVSSDLLSDFVLSYGDKEAPEKTGGGGSPILPSASPTASASGKPSAKPSASGTAKASTSAKPSATATK